MYKITQDFKGTLRLLSPIAFALALTACETTHQGSNVSYDITAPAQESSSFYLVKAESSKGNTQIDWYLLALEALINENNLSRAGQLVNQLAKKPMSPLQLSEWQLERARLEEVKGNYQKAVGQLNFQSSWRLPPEQFLRYYLLKVRLYQRINNVPSAILSATQAAHFITDPMEKEKNWLYIWDALNNMPEYQLNALVQVGNATLTSWIDLIKQLRIYTNNPNQQQALLKDWIEKNPDHPAALYMPIHLTNLQAMTISRPDKVGVLLPLTGRFAAQGKAIRNGILQGLLDDKENAKKPSIHFYDTHKLSMSNIVNKLKTDQIQFVIGPLQKHKVSEYIETSQHIYPTLAMNVLSGQKKGIPNTCFFTLSPEQEAKQAASHLAEKVHEFPLVIAPNSSLGKRVSSAFTNAWKAKTGKKAEVVFFNNTASMQQTIQNAFGLTDSQKRANDINKLLNLSSKSEQRSRRDIDAVYLIATSDELTLLKPFIEVTINPDATPPQLYASSRGNNRVRGMGEIGELRGIEFTDVPLIISRATPTGETFYEQWPNMSNGTIRLYALGLDAYSLIEGLPSMQSQPDFQLEGHSGLLTMGEFCTINRTLPWMRFGEDNFVIAQ